MRGNRPDAVRQKCPRPHSGRCVTDNTFEVGAEPAREDSRHKAALTSLIYGPTDWSGAAALIALAVLAGQNKRITIAFDHICRDLWSLGRGTAEWPHEQAMVVGLLFVDHYSKEARTYIQKYFERMQKESK